MSKTLVTFMVLIVLALGMTACGDKTPAENVTAAGEAVGNAVQATGEFLNQPKDLHVKAAQEKLDEIEQNWRDLFATATPTTDKAKAELQNADRQMAKTLATAKTKLVEARDASDKDWQQNVEPAI